MAKAGKAPLAHRGVFVSYRRDDSAYIAATINERLQQRFGSKSVFFDIDTIPPGTDFRKHISDAVGKCDVLIAIIGDAWLSAVDDQGNRRLDNPGDSVRLEIEAALTRGIPVVPILVEGARMPSQSDLPSSLHDLAFRNATEVRPGHDLQQHLTRLVTAIEEFVEPQADMTEVAPAASRESVADAQRGGGDASHTIATGNREKPRFLDVPRGFILVALLTVATTTFVNLMNGVVLESEVVFVIFVSWALIVLVVNVLATALRSKWYV
jgi:hypothetical protein